MKITVNDNNEKHLSQNARLLHGIRTKLILLFFVPILLIILLGILSYRKSSKGLIENYENAALSSMNTMGDYFELGFSNSVAKAKIVSTNQITNNYYAGIYQKDTLDESENFSEINRLVRTNVIVDEYIENISIFADYGQGICSNGKITSDCYERFDKSMELMGFMKNKIGEMWLGEHPVLDEIAKLKPEKYAISYVCTLQGVGTDPIGYVVLDVSKEFVVNKLNGMELATGSRVSFISMDGREIKQTETEDEFSFLAKSYYSKAVASNQMSGFEYINENGKNYLYLYSKLETSESMLCALIPKAEIIKQAEEVKQLTIGVIAVAIVIAIMIGTIVASGISKSIQMANRVLEHAANGDMTQRLDLKRKDEFGKLSHSVNYTIEGMKKLILQMERESNVVSSSTKEVFESSNVLLKATKEISAGVNEIEHGVTAQAQDTENCLQMMEELSDQINHVYGSINDIDRISDHAKQIVLKGIQIVEILSAKSAETSKITDIIIHSVQSLKQESSMISKIIDTIHDIAEQSNLLSLNASIEAARAGECGKGFMVVAEEIRKLAQKSSESADEIHKIIHNVQIKTDDTANSAIRAEKIVESQENALKETIVAFSNINTCVESLSNHIGTISSVIEIMEQSKEGTLKAVENISTTSQQTAAISMEFGSLTSNQLGAVESLNRAASKLEKDANEMQEAVSQFKVR